jgi:hypothetical protein
MVKLIFAAFLLFSTCCNAQFQSKIASDHIRIDHVGPSDAMIEPIIITTKKLTLPVPEVPIQVSQDIFESLTKYLDDFGNLLPEREINEFGVFKVTKRVGNKTEICFTGTRKKSVKFLTEFKKLLKDVGAADELVKKIERVLKRIDY